jgi:hypothetical protein
MHYYYAIGTNQQMDTLFTISGMHNCDSCGMNELNNHSDQFLNKQISLDKVIVTSITSIL